MSFNRLSCRSATFIFVVFLFLLFSIGMYLDLFIERIYNVFDFYKFIIMANLMNLEQVFSWILAPPSPEVYEATSNFLMNPMYHFVIINSCILIICYV